MTLLELRNKIDTIIEKTPSLADVDRIGIVTSTESNGWKEMTRLEDFRPISCDGQGMVAFELVMEE